MVSPQLRFDAGLGEGSLNLFAAVVGASSSGKSSGTAVARDLIALPPYLAEPGRFRDGIGIGTGEGLAEAFMGYETRDSLELLKNGSPKQEKVRTQVRENVFGYIDEGQSLTQMIERTGATIGPALRSAWAGEVLGQANAREETTRHLPARSYSLGLVIGYQPQTIQPLLADAAPGTPQRFLYASAIDPSIPDEQPWYPGKIHIDLTWPGGVAGTARTGIIGFAEPICRELWQLKIGKARGEVVEVNPLDGHASFTWCKTAALLAVLDGRFTVSGEDWQLAKTVWKTSCGVRDAMVVWGQGERQRKAEDGHTAAAVRDTRLAEARDDRLDADIAGQAKRLALILHSAPPGKGLSEGKLKQQLKSSKRHLFADAMEYAQSRDWIMDGSGPRLRIDGSLAPGTSVFVAGFAKPVV
jgi:hypothetical protein